ncbi:GH92 family glycosyl hydrolase, partial [Actinokineospora spheciospongiae]|uniref:GH92 family glycosyl hydrolase n=1 Tax=Actinokineospora spheciospongiae TaxID=909613 RepID=UPI000550DC0E
MGFRTSFAPAEPRPTPIRRGPLRVRVTRGPWRTPTSRRHHGLTGRHALRYDARGASTVRLFHVDIPVDPDTELTYAIHPARTKHPAQPGTHTAITLTLDDGTHLTEGDPRALIPEQWNLRRIPLGAHTGRTITTIALTHDPYTPTAPTVTTERSAITAPHTLDRGTRTRAHGWIDTLTIAPTTPAPTDPVERALTTRGTHSTRRYSRGNTLPATAVPHGFNFWTPITHAARTNWEYAWHRNTGLQAIGLSHLPSPWMGDRNTFHLMPTTGTRVGRRARSRRFDHTDETAHPHHYAVTLADGVRAEVTPTDHGAVLRFTYPAGAPANIVLDNTGLTGTAGRVHIDPDTGTITAHTDVRSGLSAGATRMWVHATTDHPVRDAHNRLRGLSRARTALLRHHTTPDTPTTITLRIATSLISPEQAEDNLRTEIGEATFDDIRARAHTAWHPHLNRIHVDGATPEQLTTLHSCLYRLHLYPNNGSEGTRYRSPFTGQVTNGHIMVNNGFWDTYRTCWPAYALFTPTLCGHFIDGFLQHHRDSGWIARWSSPGHANLMTGTNSDTAFADAHAKGVHGFDPHTAYRAALRNATTRPPHDAVGRKGHTHATFAHFTPTTIPEGLSWAMEGCVNDAATAAMATRLGDHDTAAYLTDRARHHRHHFDPTTGFYQGLTPEGTPRLRADHYDPRTWGHDYTETNGWTAAFAAPHDPDGLTDLHGGPHALADTLDRYFTTPEDATRPGSYRRPIHEMREARDVRLGQYGHSNQPAHHIAYLYTHTPRPWRTQEIVRDICTRLYQGATIGQGHLGDEDNGEMSAWYLFSALGFYPLTPAATTYAIGSPLFRKATVHLDSGNTLTINAPDNSPDNIYVASLHINGTPHHTPHIPHHLLAAGATLDFTMSPTPTTWF